MRFGRLPISGELMKKAKSAKIVQPSLSGDAVRHTFLRHFDKQTSDKDISHKGKKGDSTSGRFLLPLNYASVESANSPTAIGGSG